MSGRLELERPRDVPELLGDALRVYRAYFWTFLLLAAVFVIPVELIVSGLGLEQLTARYDSSPSAVETVIPTAVAFLVIAPLVTATCIYALRDVGMGERPHTGRSIQSGLDAFTPVFLAILLAAIGIVVGLALFILPGLYLAVRWFFVPQAVVLEAARGARALSASGDLVQGRWWRTLGIVALTNLIAAVPGILLLGPFTAWADSADRALPQLVGGMIAETVTAPFVALVSTLLFFDLRARRSVP